MKWMLWDFSGQQNHLLLSDRPCIATAGMDDPKLGDRVAYRSLEGVHGDQDGSGFQHHAASGPEDPADAHERECGRQRQDAHLWTR